jgi:hypothetical protein
MGDALMAALALVPPLAHLVLMAAMGLSAVVLFMGADDER